MFIIENEAVGILSKRVSNINVQTWSRVDNEAWPLEQPKTFTPLVLIQHKDHRNIKQSTAVTEFVSQGIDKILPCTEICKHEINTNKLSLQKKLDNYEHLQEVLSTSEVTKEVTEILAPLETSNDPQFILIEGAPGMGKSFLLKEIARRWGKKEVLQKFKLVLLIYLRDPAVQQMSLIKDLLKSFCKGDEHATEIASSSSKYFFNNDGEDLALLLDGYDEMLQKDGLIADILKRKLLPHCSLVVTSRSHASVVLRREATVKIDIWGFTEAEREHYIKESMKGKPQKINELTQYLQSHSTISSLCFVPFNLVVLVYLYKQGIPLPKSSADLYRYFICLTICRHLTKLGHHLQSNISELTDLPEPYNEIIQQLSKLSLQALNANKLIFTLDEIKKVCPDIEATPEAINGFGLLQAVEHFGLTGTTKTFNFLHFSIQEYLAAYHLINLSADEELRIIENNFWNSIHFNMFSMYIALTKGQRPSFKYFLSGGNKEVIISDKFLDNQLQCFRLYYYFHEAGDVDICKTIEQSIAHIDLSNITLTASDMECVTVFLTSSFQREWMMLDLTNCYIQDHGLHILHRGLCHCNITIDQLWLGNNNLTVQSASLISEITVKCKAKELWIGGNYTIGEDQQLYSMLTNSSTVLQELSMINVKLSSKGAIDLFKALRDNNTLKILYIKANKIADDACDAIITALQRNTCLVQLFLHVNPLTGETIVKIVSSMKANNTLAFLGLPIFSKDIQAKIYSLQQNINKQREGQGCGTLSIY